MTISIRGDKRNSRLFWGLGLAVIAVLAPSCGGGGGGGGSAPPQGLTITTTSLPAGTQGSPYFQTLAASSGTTPYTWSVVLGSLPQGLSLSAAGVISGFPTARTVGVFTVQVSDSAAPQNSNQRILSRNQ